MLTYEVQQVTDLFTTAYCVIRPRSLPTHNDMLISFKIFMYMRRHNLVRWAV